MTDSKQHSTPFWTDDGFKVVLVEEYDLMKAERDAYILKSDSLEEQYEVATREARANLTRWERSERRNEELQEQYENLVALRDDLTLKAYERGQEVERLKEQLEAARSALRAFVNAMESADVIRVEPSYLGFEVALSMADHALASSSALEYVEDMAGNRHPVSSPASEPKA